MDEIDTANDQYQEAQDKNIAAIRARAESMPKGYSGICDMCEEESLRLVNGECAPCRDKYK